MRRKVKTLFMMLGLLRTYRNIRHYRHNKIIKEKYLSFYRQFINKGDLCFDIGGNVGRRTEIFLKLGATVVTAEPHDGCMKELQMVFGKNKKVTLIHKALGEKEGFFEMMTITEVTQISSLSQNWVNILHASDKYEKYDKTVKVPVTTLDLLIQQFGIPVFCKIDVEGFEEEVLKGLTQPIRMVSFEFHSHSGVIDSTINCIKYLSMMGRVHYNYSLEESVTWNLPEWVESEEICGELLSMADAKNYHGGDVYARFTEIL
jgi:FkbM family methyltransferase